MKTYFLLLLLACNIFSLSAQVNPLKDSTPALCNWNLADPIYKVIQNTKKAISYARDPGSADYMDVSYNKDESSGLCNPADKCSNKTFTLKYDVYYPLHDYTQLKLPAVILFHGGSFEECNYRDQEIMENLCQEFAKRGFVAFNVEYRRGKIADSRKPNYQSVQEILAAYRALQDCRGAVRSIIKRQRMHDNSFPDDPYQIDTNNIFIGGVSAGAIMALTAAWYTNPMIVDAFGGSRGDVSITDALGPIDADYYFGEPDIDFKSRVKGIVSLWGALPIPVDFLLNQSAFFTQRAAATLKPVIAFHGARDLVLPFYMNASQLAYFSPPPLGKETNYNSESRCLLKSPFTLPGNEEPDLVSGSSLNIYTIAKKLNKSMPMELYVDCQMGHGLDLVDGPGFQSDFGTGLDSSKLVTKYMVARASIFFQSVMNGATAEDIGPPSIFTECVNTRIKCHPADNPNNCNDYMICNP